MSREGEASRDGVRVHGRLGGVAAGERRGAEQPLLEERLLPVVLVYRGVPRVVGVRFERDCTHRRRVALSLGSSPAHSRAPRLQDDPPDLPAVAAENADGGQSLKRELTTDRVLAFDADVAERSCERLVDDGRFIPRHLITRGESVDGPKP